VVVSQASCLEPLLLVYRVRWQALIDHQVIRLVGKKSSVAEFYSFDDDYVMTVSRPLGAFNAAGFMYSMAEMHAGSCGARVDGEVDVAVLPLLIAYKRGFELDRVVDLAETKGYSASLPKHRLVKENKDRFW